MESDNMPIIHGAYGLREKMGVTRMYFSKMESDLLPRFHGSIGPVLYIKYQHPGGDSLSDSLPAENSEKKHPQEDVLPRNNQENTEEQLPQVHREHSENELKVKRSRTRHPGRWSRKRTKQLATLGEDEGPFSEKNVRRAFIRKIYLILTIQLGFTVGIICLFVYWRFLKIWVRRRPWFCYALLPAILILAITLACCDHARRKVPLNYILLLIFTILEGMLLGSIASFFDADGIMWAVAGTAFVTLGLSLFALQTKWDLTITSGVLLALIFVFLAFGILSVSLKSMIINIFLLFEDCVDPKMHKPFSPRPRTYLLLINCTLPLQLITVVYAAVGTLLFAIYLVVDTQLMLGRTHHYRLNPDEYIFAVLNVYIDIINMCLFILQFVGFMK